MQALTSSRQRLATHALAVESSRFHQDDLRHGSRAQLVEARLGGVETDSDIRGQMTERTIGYSKNSWRMVLAGVFGG